MRIRGSVGIVRLVRLGSRKPRTPRRKSPWGMRRSHSRRLVAVLHHSAVDSRGRLDEHVLTVTSSGTSTPGRGVAAQLIDDDLARHGAVLGGRTSGWESPPCIRRGATHDRGRM